MPEQIDFKARKAMQVVEWCCDRWNMEPDIKLLLVEYSDIDCWGYADRISPGVFEVAIARNQRLRSFLATVVHEMVHVRQYMTGRWRGDGEREAERLQYLIVDSLWKRGVI